MKIVAPSEEIKNITKPVWTSIKKCIECSTQCDLEPKDIDTEQSAFTMKFLIEYFSWTSHFWRCPICNKLNNFHSFRYDNYVIELEKYIKLLEFKDSVDQHGGFTYDEEETV